MYFASFSVSRSILKMPTFRELCSPLHQGEKQPDTELFLHDVPFILYCLLEWWMGERWWNWSVFNNELRKFLISLNNQHPNIHFTIDIKENGKLLFLDVLVSKKADGTLDYQVYKINTYR